MGSEQTAGRNCRGSRGYLSAGNKGMAERAQSPEQRDVRQPRQWPHNPARPPNGDIEEGPDNFRVKLLAGARGQLAARRRGAEGGLVGTVGRHDLEGVGNCDDAGGERDLVAGKTEGIAGAVSLIMLVGVAAQP